MYAQDNFLGYTRGFALAGNIAPSILVSALISDPKFSPSIVFISRVFCSRFRFDREGKRHIRGDNASVEKCVPATDRTLVSEKPLTSRRKSYYAEKTHAARWSLFG